MILTSPLPLVAPQPQEETQALWQKELKEAVRDPFELCRRLDLPESFAREAISAQGSFPLFAPQSYIARMKKGDPSDPLLRQVLPLSEEQAVVKGFSNDPVDDASALQTPGLLQKYQGRVLLIVTGACAVHCRYCFRRHFPYSDGPKTTDDWTPALEQIAADTNIHEVILSGGDPLTVVDHRLKTLAMRLAEIPHLRRLRIHTRFPVMIPGRVNEQFVEWFCGTRLTPVMVIHANHPAELDADVGKALGRVAEAGATLLNQAVLLKGINDRADTLAELSEKLLDYRVLPYYLHQLDKVAGGAHFEVSESRGLAIMQELRRILPGYAVPRYVREIPGAAHKVELNPHTD